MKTVLLILLHLALGVWSYYVPPVAAIWTGLFVFYSLDRLNRFKNKDGWAHFAAAYLAGIEVWIRAHQFPFMPWEFGKYAIIAFLLLGLFLEAKRKESPRMAYFYLALLLPSFFIIQFPDFEEARQEILFNLSGPLLLFVSWIYFYKRNLSSSDFMKAFKFYAIGTMPMVARIFTHLPDLTHYQFKGFSDPHLSGDFGPNQVATVMGTGFALISTALIIKKSVFQKRGLDIALCILFAALSILTMSRGGIFTALLAVAAGGFVFVISEGRVKQARNLMMGAAVFSIIGVFLWNYLNEITANSLEGRYEDTFHPSVYHKDVESSIYVSGRDVIVVQDIELFKLYPFLGVGPGMSKIAKAKEGMLAITPHTELTRLLAEHGMYGLVALIILILSPLLYFRKISSSAGKAVLVVFIVTSLGTMTHAAMRLAIPGFFFGFAFTNYFESVLNPLAKNYGSARWKIKYAN